VRPSPAPLFVHCSSTAGPLSTAGSHTHPPSHPPAPPPPRRPPWTPRPPRPRRRSHPRPRQPPRLDPGQTPPHPPPPPALEAPTALAARAAAAAPSSQSTRRPRPPHGRPAPLPAAPRSPPRPRPWPPTALRSPAGTCDRSQREQTRRQDGTSRAGRCTGRRDAQDGHAMRRAYTPSRERSAFALTAAARVCVVGRAPGAGGQGRWSGRRHRAQLAGWPRVAIGGMALADVSAAVT
jgi:hypothetical protein